MLNLNRPQKIQSVKQSRDALIMALKFRAVKSLYSSIDISKEASFDVQNMCYERPHNFISLVNSMHAQLVIDTVLNNKKYPQAV